MIGGRTATPGKTRTCPHCKATILESASVCPACQHHLQFSPGAQRRAPDLLPLRVEGRIVHPEPEEPWEYCVVISIRNERGEEITRQVVGVGAMQGTEQRTFTLSVEAFKTGASPAPPRGIDRFAVKKK